MAENNVPYLTLSPDVEEAIRADRAAGRVSPYRTDDTDVVRREDFAHDRATLTRPAFVRDTEKVLNLPAYNRYADKTQVFSFAENDEISRRGLHVQLVSRVARGIESLLGLNCDLIEAIASATTRAHRPRRRAFSVGLLPRAHRAHLQPQRALGAGARQPVPPTSCRRSMGCSATTASSPSRCCAWERRPRSSSWMAGGGLHADESTIKTLRPSRWRAAWCAWPT
ncbi:MAG: hypothetical protein ACLUE1_00040 [Adlercreutzia equolifaciens]